MQLCRLRSGWLRVPLPVTDCFVIPMAPLSKVIQDFHVIFVSHILTDVGVLREYEFDLLKDTDEQ